MRLIDLEPKTEAFLADAETSLAESPPRLHSKHLYDEAGSDLFDAITRVPEYYLTRVERSIFETYLPEMADAVGAGARVVEFGAGLGDKTRHLIEALHDPAEVVLIDISKEALIRGATGLESTFEGLDVTAICADYDEQITLDASAHRSVVFFPGSTLGNFTQSAAIEFLGRQARLAGPGGGLILGVDLVKDLPTLIAAYDDAAGVTAAFNLNLLTRLVEAGGQAEPTHFKHESRWNPVHDRIEMHLVATEPTSLKVGATTLQLEAGDSLLTEHCHKYTPARLDAILTQAGWTRARTWTDADAKFAVIWATA
ncbi:MAG: L-histidine N(alpha)-methyltransferase [Proteobacteria bacterium]|nr:L-histidine N(alpha)-methyltransferase [Pseudomonadota bacterium]